MARMKYLALGDSISIDDYTEVEGGGAVNQFARLIYAAALEDFTQDGRTTQGVLADLGRITLAPDVVTFTIGGNDFLQATFRHTPPLGNLAPHYWLGLIQPVASISRIANTCRNSTAPLF